MCFYNGLRLTNLMLVFLIPMIVSNVVTGSVLLQQGSRLFKSPTTLGAPHAVDM